MAAALPSPLLPSSHPPLSSQVGFNTARWRLRGHDALAMKAAEEANKEAEKAAKHTEELYSNPQTTTAVLVAAKRAATEAKQRAVEADRHARRSNSELLTEELRHGLKHSGFMLGDILRYLLEDPGDLGKMIDEMQFVRAGPSLPCHLAILPSPRPSAMQVRALMKRFGYRGTPWVLYDVFHRSTKITTARFVSMSSGSG